MADKIDIRTVMDDLDTLDGRAGGLIHEVLASAFIALKEDPSLSIVEAMEAGCEEWDV